MVTLITLLLYHAVWITLDDQPQQKSIYGAIWGYCNGFIYLGAKLWEMTNLINPSKLNMLVWKLQTF